MKRLASWLAAPSRWPCALSLAVVGLVYHRLLFVYFWADDFSTFREVVDWGFFKFFLRPIAGHVYLVRNIFFAGPYLLFGLRPEPYGFIGLAIQLTNALFVCRITHRLTGSPILAAFGGVLWGACPTHADAVGWFTVHGHALATLAPLAALDRIRVTENGALSITRRNAAIAMVALVLGVTCSGGGFAMSLATPVAMLALVPARNRERGAGWILAAIVPVALTVYVGAQQLYTRLYGPLPALEKMAAYWGLFGLEKVARYQRALLEKGVVALLLRTFKPNEIPETEGGIALVLYGTTVWLGLLLGSWDERRRSVVWMFLAAGMYGTIALGRSAFSELSAIAGEPRYHYCATTFLTFLLLSSAAVVAREVRRSKAVAGTMFGAWAAVALVHHFTRPWQLNEYEGCRASIAEALEKLDRAVEAHPRGTPLTLVNEDVGGCFIFPGGERAAGLYAVARTREAFVERRVRFVTDSQLELIWAKDPTRRLSSLFLPAPGVTVPEYGLPSPVPRQAVDDALQEYLTASSRKGEELGCPEGWFTGFVYRRSVTALLSDTRCPRENWELAKCYREHEHDVVCSSEGEIVRRPLCDHLRQTLTDCSTYKD